MSLKLRELIKKVRSCKTAEEERSVVNKETSEIRTLNRDQTDQVKSRNLVKAIYIHMLGYQTSFVQMTCVNLLVSLNFSDKRIAYIALCLLLDEKSEVLLLTANTIKKDLENSNQFINAIALNAIGEACTADMCRQLSSEVVKLMSNTNPFIKKKAALAAGKIVRKCPDLIESFLDKLGNYLDEKNHGVLICGVTLAIQIFKHDIKYIEKFRKFQPIITKFMKTLVSTNYAPEYDINGVTDPFLQVRLIELMSYYGRNNSSASDEMSDIIASISTNTESHKNTGNAVLYELVKTILSIDANTALINLSSNILGKMLTNKDNNYKYISLRTLQSVARTDLISVQKHKNTIIECMKDPDISIQRRALDLVYLIINTSNIKQIMKEYLNFLVIAEPEMKIELTSKICQSLETYSPSLKWQIDTLIKMLCLAGNYVTETTLSSVINLIISTKQLHIYSVHKIFFSVKNNLSEEGLVKVALYTFGELGNLLVTNSVLGPDNETIIITDQILLGLIDQIQCKKYDNCSTKEYLLNCLVKLSVRLNETNIERIRGMIESENNSFYPEVQQRASEYLVLLRPNLKVLKQRILEGIPMSSIVKEFDIKKEVVVEDFENEYSEIKYSESNIKFDKKSPQNDINKFSNENKGNDLLIDLNNIFSSNNYSSINNDDNLISNTKNTNFGNQIGTTDALESIFSTISLITSSQNKESENISMNFPLNTLIESSTPSINNNNLDLMNNLYAPSITKNEPPEISINLPNTQENSMKQIFKNSHLTLYQTSIKSNANSLNLIFNISNNVSSQIQNIRLQYSVPKYIDRNINIPSGNSLAPLASFGIQQTVQLTNNQIEKQVILKIRIIYTVEKMEYTEITQVEEF